MLHTIRTCIESALSRAERSAIDPRRFLCVDGSRGRVDGGCCLFLAPDGAEPVLVAKAARSPERQAAYRTEFENLRTLDATGLNAARRSTPRPLGMAEEGGVLVTLQSALPGRLMRSLPGRELFSRDGAGATVRRACSWQRELEQTFAPRRVTVDGALYEREVLALVRRIRRRFLLETDEIAFLTRRFEHDRRLLGLELPLTVGHGDFCAANLVVQDGGIGAFDWEHALVHRLPLYDLFFFFSSTRFPFRGLRRESSYARSLVAAFWGENHLNRLLREQLQAACSALAIPDAAVSDLFLLALLLRADRKYDTFAAAAGIADPAAGAAESEKRRAWAALAEHERDAPLLWMRAGTLLSLRHAVRYGLPAFAADPACP